MAGGVPNPTSGGGALTAWTVISYLLSQGHEVAVCALHDREYLDPTGAAAEDRVEALRALGAQVVAIPSRSADFFRSLPSSLDDRLRRAWRPADEELYPHLVDAEIVREAVEELEPEAVFVYHFEALAASRALRAFPRFAAVGDPSHLPPLYRWRQAARRPSLGTLRSLVRLQALLRNQPRLMARLLNECQAAGAFAAHHAEWLRRRGVAGCRYLRTPVPDEAGPQWRETRDRLATNERPRILLLGHLAGVVTLNGLEIFAREVLPALERALGADGFEARIVGGFEPPPELRAALARPAVRFAGHREDPSDEFASADVLLVPNSIPLGVRVRVIAGCSHGCCVVTHRANTLGIPELGHGDNALIGTSGRELARHVLRALADRELRARLEEGARATYERYFAPAVAAARIAETLEELVRTAPRAAAGRASS